MKKKINIFAVVSVTILILYTITLVVPLLWVLFTSFKDPIEFDLNKFGFTTKLSFDNYVTVMKSLFIFRHSPKILLLKSPERLK